MTKNQSKSLCYTYYNALINLSRYSKLPGIIDIVSTDYLPTIAEKPGCIKKLRSITVKTWPFIKFITYNIFAHSSYSKHVTFQQYQILYNYLEI